MKADNVDKKLLKLLEKAEELDWSYEVYYEPKYQHSRYERYYVELEKYSPAGEDFIMMIEFDNDDAVDSFMENLNDYLDDFDIDEHVEMWIPSRGKGGCPSSISELVDDAKAIKEMIEELRDKLEDCIKEY